MSDPLIVAPLPGRRMGWIVLAAGLWIAMAEINRLSGQLLDATGQSHPFTSLMGPTSAFSAAGSWEAVANGAHSSWARTLLLTYLALDVGFIVLYRRGIAGISLGSGEQKRRPLKRWVTVLAVADLVEDALAAFTMIAFAGTGSRVPWLESAAAWATAAATGAKWLGVGGVVVGFVLTYRHDPAHEWRTAVEGVRHALWFQRFSLFSIGFVAFLSLVPGGSVLDQLPDAQRAWIDDWAGLRYAVCATAAVAILVLVLFALGRWRLIQAIRWTNQEAPATGSGYLLWLVGPALLFAAGLALKYGAGQDVLLWRLLFFTGVPAGVVFGGSWLIRSRKWAQPPRKREAYAEEQLVRIAQVGDAVAILTVSVSGLALVRSFTAPSALWLIGQSPQRPLVALVAGLVGLLLAVLAVPFLAGQGRTWFADHTYTYLKFFAGIARPRENAANPPGKVLRLTCLGGSVAAFLALCLFPGWAAWALGFLTCAVLSLASLVLMVGILVIYTQDTAPPEVFRIKKLRPLRATPVMSLLLAVVLIGSFFGQNIHIHGVRGAVLSARTITPIVRPNLDDAFGQWLKDGSCEFTLPLKDPNQPSESLGSLRVKPMLLVAAEGGGIRAAYWTAKGLQTIADSSTGHCAATSTFFSGGASGGAVGLTVARYTSTPVTDVKAMAEPEALGAAAIGLFDRDPLFGATGIGLPTIGGFPGADHGSIRRTTTWLDRAGLIELAWQSASPGLDQPYVVPKAQLGDNASPAFVGKGLSGQLILNSTEVGPGCRALVSQVNLGGKSDAEPDNSDPPCDNASGVAPHSIDLFQTYGPDFAGGSKGSSENCLDQIKAATGALLASRFPYVTPSGYVGPCRSVSRQQLVDGGYTENSGLGTIVDLAPQWQALVRKQNALALAAACPAQDGSGCPDPSTDAAAIAAQPAFVLPIVVYLDNGYGNDASPQHHGVTPELDVPLAAKSSSGDAQKQPPALLRRAADVVSLSSICPSTGSLCDLLGQQLAAQRRVVVINPQTTPSVPAPLGWVLSGTSEKGMDRAMATQMANSCQTPTGGTPSGLAGSDSMCRNGYGSLYDLMQLLKTP